MKMKFSCLLASALLLSSCFSITSDALMCTASFSSEVQPNTPYAFYRVGELYYLTCEVEYVCKRENSTIAFVPFSAKEHVTVPIGVQREPIRKRFYFLLMPDVAKRALGVESSAVPADARYCIPAEEWDATAAVQVYSPIKKAHITVRCWDPAPCKYYTAPSQFDLFVPTYRPWDYWVKAPLGAVLLLGVDVPCTVVGTAGRLGWELVSYPFVAPFQHAAEPEVILVNNVPKKTKSEN